MIFRLIYAERLLNKFLGGNTSKKNHASFQVTLKSSNKAAHSKPRNIIGAIKSLEVL